MSKISSSFLQKSTTLYHISHNAQTGQAKDPQTIAIIKAIIFFIDSFSIFLSTSFNKSDHSKSSCLSLAFKY